MPGFIKTSPKRENFLGSDLDVPPPNKNAIISQFLPTSWLGSIFNLWSQGWNLVFLSEQIENIFLIRRSAPSQDRTLIGYQCGQSFSFLGHLNFPQIYQRHIITISPNKLFGKLKEDRLAALKPKPKTFQTLNEWKLRSFREMQKELVQKCKRLNRIATLSSCISWPYQFPR